jgi:hypothetical protein
LQIETLTSSGQNQTPESTASRSAPGRAHTPAVPVAEARTTLEINGKEPLDSDHFADRRRLLPLAESSAAFRKALLRITIAWRNSLLVALPNDISPAKAPRAVASPLIGKRLGG